MIKEIRVAGVTLGNYTVRESLMQIDKALYEDRFITIEEVNMRSLFLAREDALVKKTIESADLTVITEVGILEAAGERGAHLRREIVDNDFFYQFFRRLERSNQQVLLLGETEEETELARAFIQEEFPRVLIQGVYTLNDHNGDEDAIINDMNAEGASVIISVIPSPRQEYFLASQRDKLAANLWYGVGEGRFLRPKNRIATGFMKLFRTKKLMKYIKSYEEQNAKTEQKEI